MLRVRIAGTVVAFWILAANGFPQIAAETARPSLRLLFLGDNALHRPADRAAQLVPVLERRGIRVQYTDNPAVLAAETLAPFDGLILYANIASLTPEQESALLEYIAAGHGFIALHCATACFPSSDKFVELVGAQFQKHGAEVFRTEIAETAPPILDGYGGFSSWDETYVHHRHHNDRTVLEYRRQGMQAEGNDREPWTWVRTHGTGRVFYTAWGHDHRTWGHPGFHNLVERGIRWACGGDPRAAGDYSEREPFTPPEMTAPRTDVEPFAYVEVGAKIPNYRPGGKGVGAFTTMQQPLPTAESIKHYVTPVGFEMQLFADETNLGGKPIAMTWDERGRLWVCETYDYPNELQPAGQGRDRIRICEDTNGDERADRFTVFAEQLSIPTAIAICRGGAIVQNGTETLYLKDTDGDDRADVRETLLTGWFLGDTHGGVSNFQYGHDNWIWAMQGYNNSTPTVNGKGFQTFRMGFFRFKLNDNDPPQVTDVEFIRSTNNNTWGLGFSEEGIVFGSTANMHPSIYMPIANRYYERVKGFAPELLSSMADTHLFKAITDKVRQVDVHGGYTAGAGHAVYTARTYPPTWWNRTAFVCGPTGHLVGTFVLKPEGADFHSSSPCNLAASDDEWSAPIMAEVGPDGNVWVIDWYNYIVQHNPTPPGFKTGKGNAYESDLRDKKHGRIYRVIYRGDASGDATSVAIPDLQGASPDALVSTLAHPTMLWRKHAQRLLVERGQTDVAAALIELATDQTVDEIGLNAGAIHALWTLHGLGVLDGSDEPALRAAVAALRHPSAGVRRNAIQVLPATAPVVNALLDSGVFHDEDAQVRLAAHLALADAPPGDRAAQALAGSASDVTTMSDRWLPDAVTSAAAVNGLPFLQIISRSGAAPYRRPGDKRDSLVKIVAGHLARSGMGSDEIDVLTGVLPVAAPAVTQDILAGLADGWPTDSRATLSAVSEERLLELIDELPVASQGHLIRITNLLGSERFSKHAAQIASAFLETVGNEQQPVDARVAAAGQLVQFQPQDDAVVQRLLDLITPQTPPELADGLIASLTGSVASGLTAEIVERSNSLTPAARAAAIRVLLSRPATTAALLDAIDQGAGAMQLTDLTLDQKQSLSNHPDRPLRMRAREILAREGGLPSPDRQKVLETLAHVADESGDPAAGKEVLKKHCAACHTHSGEGTRIGPDLTGMAVHPKHELLAQILDPSRSVEANFRLYTVVTNDGLVLDGMLANETRTTIELVDTKAKRHTLERENVQELVSSTKSLMPEGFEKQMPETDLVNLLAFLSVRGKYLPMPLDKAATTVSTQ
ncbi:MAG: PVC-type heme-binding CxxCH protein, partial [Planctomycetaceae bacterium]